MENLQYGEVMNALANFIIRVSKGQFRATAHTSGNDEKTATPEEIAVLPEVAETYLRYSSD